MAKGISGTEPDPRVVYSDIIDLPHWQSPVRKHMSLYDRAAQFSPFAALTGYDEMIEEEARVTDNRIEMSAEETEHLNRKLMLIGELISRGRHPFVTVTYFIPDQLKSGGTYKTISGKAKKVDASKSVIVLQDASAGEQTIVLEDILDIEGNLRFETSAPN